MGLFWTLGTSRKCALLSGDHPSSRAAQTSAPLSRINRCFPPVFSGERICGRLPGSRSASRDSTSQKSVSKSDGRCESTGSTPLALPFCQRRADAFGLGQGAEPAPLQALCEVRRKWSGGVEGVGGASQWQNRSGRWACNSCGSCQAPRSQAHAQSKEKGRSRLERSCLDPLYGGVCRCRKNHFANSAEKT